MPVSLGISDGRDLQWLWYIEYALGYLFLNVRATPAPQEP